MTKKNKQKRNYHQKARKSEENNARCIDSCQVEKNGICTECEEWSEVVTKSSSGATTAKEKN